MRLFAGMQEISTKNIYEKEIKDNLKPKDGKIHVIMITSSSGCGNQIFGYDDKYTMQLDELLMNMQNNDYEIVDIKFNVIQNQNLSSGIKEFNTLIMYK